MSELKLITPPRNFLMRPLPVPGCPIGIVAADDPRERIAHHQAELEKAWRDYYGPRHCPNLGGCATAGRHLYVAWQAMAGVVVLYDLFIGRRVSPRSFRQRQA